ncbi:hypothetical protein DPMN_070214 [Dreissena polymorpha]|uniref:Uncharacterized protein n=1 Tax=Dreissena polymorpha TaxID=45954 RepID=A0A9D3Z4Y7_DREPO|nr:hypothetical protein DPMN_070214 [Dreissena polymorpha]
MDAEERKENAEMISNMIKLLRMVMIMNIMRLIPPNSPDLAPMDFRDFPEVKSQLRGIRFASKQELTVAAKRIVSSFDADWLRGEEPTKPKYSPEIPFVPTSYEPHMRRESVLNPDRCDENRVYQPLR